MTVLMSCFVENPSMLVPYRKVVTPHVYLRTFL